MPVARSREDKHGAIAGLRITRPTLAALAVVIGTTVALTGSVPAATASPSALATVAAGSGIPAAGEHRIAIASLIPGTHPESQYVAARPVTRNGMLRARAAAIGPWEKFDVIFTPSDGSYSIRSRANAKWVSAEVSNTGSNYGMLRARAGAVGPWEKFDIIQSPSDGSYSFQSWKNANWVSAELAYR